MTNAGVRCGQCGEALTEKTRFCPSCGRSVASEVFDTQTVAHGSSRPSATPVSSARSSREGRFAPGAVLANRYRIVALLGKGGMGEVYRADDLTLDQPVALKFLPESLSSHPQAAARFRNEVRIARQVSHPNVCRVYDITEFDGMYVLSMEYVDGEDLASLLRRIGRLPTDKAVEISRKLCAGLAAAHEKGVLHRDLKPSNIMLDSRGQVLLTDFGLAGLAGQIEGSEIRNGTPAYMAPEQLAGEEVTVKSDIYSLGLVLYEIFTGKLPFESDTLAGLQRARAESRPESLTTLVKDLDPAVERVILRCLEPKPAMRPASALAVAAALPGGDPLAAALAAGETPSPQMVAAAGEGMGLKPLIAIPLFLFILVEIVVAIVRYVPIGALELIQPRLSPEVLTQKAREVIQHVGYKSPAADEGTGLNWDGDYLYSFTSGDDSHRPDWNALVKRPKSPLTFWYRQSNAPLIGLDVHDDLMTPGELSEQDPAPVIVGMIEVKLDSWGHLLSFDAMPAQHPVALKNPAPAPDWAPLFEAAGVDSSKLEADEPGWNQLQTADTRVAWKGQWPETQVPLRIEAGAFRGKPVYFQLIGKWTSPGRRATPEPPLSKQLPALIMAAVAGLAIFASPWLAYKNIAAKRSNLRGATRLAGFVFLSHAAVWLCRTHFAPSTDMIGVVLLELAAASLYGLVCWMVYMAVEPYVRKRWPQCLISWTSILEGKWRDPIVGRDIMVGLAAGAALPLTNSILNALDVKSGGAPVMGSLTVLKGLRPTLAMFLAQIPRGVSHAMLFIFVVFLLRVLLRNQWAAGVAFAIVFSVINARGTWIVYLIGFSIGAIFAFLMLRFGLLAMAVELFSYTLIQNAVWLGDTQSWYFAYPLMVEGTMVLLALWALRLSLAGQKLWSGSLLE